MFYTSRERCGYFHPYPYPVPGRPVEYRLFLHRRYYSRGEILEELKAYMEELEKDLKGVREKFSELEKKKRSPGDR
jgi:hypothetical protein